MPRSDLRRKLAKLRLLLDELEADLAEQCDPAGAADSADAADDEERYIAARVSSQLAKLRAKPAPVSARIRKAS
jgi:hypothetical protein